MGKRENGNQPFFMRKKIHFLRIIIPIEFGIQNKPVYRIFRTRKGGFSELSASAARAVTSNDISKFIRDQATLSPLKHHIDMRIMHFYVVELRFSLNLASKALKLMEQNRFRLTLREVNNEAVRSIEPFIDRVNQPATSGVEIHSSDLHPLF